MNNANQCNKSSPAYSYSNGNDENDNQRRRRRASPGITSMNTPRRTQSDTNDEKDIVKPTRSSSDDCLLQCGLTRHELTPHGRRFKRRSSKRRSLSKYGQVTSTDQAFVDVTLLGVGEFSAQMIDDSITIESTCERWKQTRIINGLGESSAQMIDDLEPPTIKNRKRTSVGMISYVQTHQLQYKNEVVWTVVTTSSYNGKESWGESSRVSIDRDGKTLRLRIIRKGSREKKNDNKTMRTNYNSKCAYGRIVDKYAYCLEDIIHESAKLREHELSKS